MIASIYPYAYEARLEEMTYGSERHKLWAQMKNFARQE